MHDDLDLAIVGGGTAGLTAAVLAAEVGARVALVESGRTGGDCLWTGCVPSKSLIATADLAHRMRHADDVGLTPTDPAIDLGHVLDRVRKVQARIAPKDSAERLEGLGVEVITDHAKLEPGGIVALGSGDRRRARSRIVATGSTPAIPPVEGLADAAPLTSDTVWDLDTLPQRLVVLGAGPVGCELSQAFARLGAEVTLVEAAQQVLPAEDPDVGELIAGCLTADGVRVRTSAQAERVDSGTVALRTGGGQREDVAYDRLLVATGRNPRTVGLGLETLGVGTGDKGAVAVDSRLRTTSPGVFAAGDVTGVLPFTHVAAYQAGIATLNALFGLRRRARYDSVPWVTFTAPEVARVGCSEAEARRRWGSKAVVTRFDYAEVDRAIAAATPHGFAKLVGDHRGRLVGAAVAAPAAGEVIAELATLVARSAKVGDVFRTVHPYPTFSVGVAAAGGEHLRARFLSPRTRRLTRPLLAVRRRSTPRRPR